MQRIVAGLGLAGINHANERNAVIAWGFPFQSIVVRSDAYTACLGAFYGANGAILIMGTGSCGFWIREGQSGSVVGWGFPVSDHASGARLGLDALSYALWGSQGRTKALMPPTSAHCSTPLSSNTLIMAAASSAVFCSSRLANPSCFSAYSKIAAAMIRVLLDKGVEQCALVGGISAFVRPWLPHTLDQSLTSIKGDALTGASIRGKKCKPDDAIGVLRCALRCGRAFSPP
jgi:glucosamine kinase